MVSLIFTDLYNLLDSITFNPEWSKVGIGRLDGIVHGDLKLNPGDQVTTVDPDERRVIITHTEHGNVLVFEKYSSYHTTSLLCIYPYRFKQRELDGPLSDVLLRSIIGYDCPNIGERYSTDLRFRSEVDVTSELEKPNWTF